MTLGNFVRALDGRLINTQHIVEIVPLRYRNTDGIGVYRIAAYLSNNEKEDLVSFLDTDPCSTVKKANLGIFWCNLFEELWKNLFTITDYRKFVADYERENIPKYSKNNGVKK